MVDFHPGDPEPPDEPYTDEDYKEMAQSHCDRIDNAGRYIAKIHLPDAEARNRVDQFREFDPEGISMVETDDQGEYIMFRNADAREFVYGLEVLSEAAAGV